MLFRCNSKKNYIYSMEEDDEIEEELDITPPFIC